MNKKLVVSSLLLASLMLGGCTAKNTGNTSSNSDDQKVIDNVVDKMQNGKWEVFNSSVGNFKVNFPKYPASKSETADVQGIKLAYTQYSSSDEDGVFYMVQYNEYTNVTAEQMNANPNSVLDGAVNGSVSSTAGNELVTSKITTYKTYPAVDYEIKNTSKGVYMKGRNILVGNKLYSLIVSNSSQSFENYDKFLGSFEIME